MAVSVSPVFRIAFASCPLALHARIGFGHRVLASPAPPGAAPRCRRRRGSNQWRYGWRASAMSGTAARRSNSERMQNPRSVSGQWYHRAAAPAGAATSAPTTSAYCQPPTAKMQPRVDADRRQSKRRFINGE